MVGTRKILRGRRTIAEKILWERIRNKQLGFKFRRQYSIGNYVLDFYCPEIKFGIEVDGEIHVSQVDMDKYRERTINSVGVKLIRIKNGDIFNDLNGVMEKIEKSLPLK